MHSKVPLTIPFNCPDIHSERNGRGYEVNHNAFVQVGLEKFCIFNMGRMSYPLFNTL